MTDKDGLDRTKESQIHIKEFSTSKLYSTHMYVLGFVPILGKDFPLILNLFVYL